MKKQLIKEAAEEILSVLDNTIGVFQDPERGYFREDFEKILRNFAQDLEEKCRLKNSKK